MKIEIDISLHELSAIILGINETLSRREGEQKIDLENVVVCKSCNKIIKESVDKDISICDSCLSGIKKKYKNGYKDWDEMTRDGKSYRIKKYKKKEKEGESEWKEVYNPEKDPQLTGTE